MSNIFYVIGASQGFLLSVFLLLNKDRKMHLPLIIMVFLASFQLLSEYLYASEQNVYSYQADPSNGAQADPLNGGKLTP